MFSSGKTIFQFYGPWGVPVQIGSSIFFLVMVFLYGARTPVDLAYDMMYLAMLVGSIYLHELGHAWGCVVQDIPVRRVVLYGGGGFCEPGRSMSRRQSELVVAMGPIVNLTIWAVASLIAPWISAPQLYWVCDTLANLNLFLAVLNLLPVMPLDGGKLLNLALCRVIPACRATAVSGAIGLLIAVLWIPAMLFSYSVLGFVLFFIPSFTLHWRMLRGTA